jgi:D-alanine-D-alanine ligase
MERRIRVTVLRGGPSAERPVSLVSGAAVAEACRRLGYQVVEADISPTDLSALDQDADVVFPVLHGIFGEDGQLQAILESRGLSYVGSDAAASRLAMDKDATKRIWQNANLPTAAWATVGSYSELAQIPDLVPPVVVKPATEGSSIGVCLCETTESLHDAVTRLAQHHGQLLVEKRLVGPELTIGVLGDRVLPIIQIKPSEGFYDYQAKYERDDTAYLLAPEIDPQTYRTVQEIAVQAFHAVVCRDFGRVDVIVDDATGPQLLEINTIPGFTPHSLLPKAATHAGIGFDQLVEQLVQMALSRRGRA